MSDAAPDSPARVTPRYPRPARSGLRPGYHAPLLLALVASASAPAAAGSLRLSEGLPFSDVSDGILGVKVSADGRYAVYIQDAVVDDARELWSVAVAGGDPVRLSGLLPAGSFVADFELTADAQTVVYWAPQDATGILELYSAPIAGPEGAWVKLNPELVAGGSVAAFALAPGAERVAFLADVTTDEITDLWSVPVEGGPATKHRPGITPVGSTVTSPYVRVSAGGVRAAFLANFSNLERSELWSARLDGVGGVVKLNGALASDNDEVYGDFKFAPNGARVVYRAAQEVAGKVELYSVAAGGGTPVKLNGTLPAEGDVFVFHVSADGSRVVYAADQEVDERTELWSVPIAGGTAVKLNGSLVAGGEVDTALYGISPDSTRVVYRADQQANDRFELWSVPIAGGTAVKLNGALVAGGDISLFDFAPDASMVVYFGDQQTDNDFALFAVPLAGGAVVRVSDPLAPGGSISGNFAVTPDGASVVYHADRVPGLKQLYRAPLAGGDSDDQRLNGALVAGGGVSLRFFLHPDGLQVLYVADQEVDNRHDLYVGDPCLLCDRFESGDFRRWN